MQKNPSKEQNKIEAHIISHTHWDREWYVPYEAFRVQLVETIDLLLDILDRNDAFRAFMLDGHTVLVEDYLEVKPQNRARLAKYVAEGRILIGPWYVLPDQVLISGESHIRNYLIGQELCAALGGGMRAGYAPDAFGHPAQIPQLYAKLGLSEIVFWRGLEGSVLKNEFLWEAPDGSRILGMHLAYGYGNCPNLPDEPQAFLARVENVCTHYLPVSNARVIPVMNGRDHLRPQAHVPAMLAQANALSETISMRHSTLPDFLASLKKKLDPAALTLRRGALYSADKIAVLEGTLSARMYLKQMLSEVESLYERYTEPFCTACALETGGAYPTDLLRTGWKTILKNEPHDSICGCCVDEVHQEMEVRFHSARQLGECLLENALSAFSRPGEAEESYITVWNPSPRACTQTLRCTVELLPRISSSLVYEQMGKRVKRADPLEHAPLPTGMLLVCENGESIRAEVLRAERTRSMRYYSYTQPHEYYVQRCELLFTAPEIPALGARSYRLVPQYEAAPETQCAAAQCAVPRIENERYIVEVSCGSTDVTDKLSGRRYTGCGALLDDADLGDEYFFNAAPDGAVTQLLPESVRAYVQADGALEKTLVVEGTLRVPDAVAWRDEGIARTADCPVRTEITLLPHANRVDFVTEIDNRAGNHRTRARFQTGLAAEEYWADSAFYVDRHPVMPEKITENEVRVRCMKSFAAVSAPGGCVSVMAKGLREIEAVRRAEGTELLLTLERGVSIIANGIHCLEYPAPEAQCLGLRRFAYSFQAFAEASDAELTECAERYCVPMRCFQLPDGSLPAFAERSFLSLSPVALKLSALKAAQDGSRAVCLRVYNSTDAETEGEAALGFAASAAFDCNLAEIPFAELPMQGGKIALKLKPWEIRTIIIEVNAE